MWRLDVCFGMPLTLHNGRNCGLGGWGCQGWIGFDGRFPFIGGDKGISCELSARNPSCRVRYESEPAQGNGGIRPRLFEATLLPWSPGFGRGLLLANPFESLLLTK